MQEITFGDVAATLIRRVQERLGDTIPVRRSPPNPRPETFVLIFRVGGQRSTRNPVQERATIAYEAWAPTPKAAHDLAQRVRAIIFSLARQRYEGMTFGEISEFSGPVDLPDPESNQERFTGTVSLSAKATQISTVA